MKLVSLSSLEKIWDELVDTHHYLGYRRLLGRRLKYIAYIGQNPVAALSWSAAAWKLRVRDQFIGWNETQRRKNLQIVQIRNLWIM